MAIQGTAAQPQWQAPIIGVLHNAAYARMVLATTQSLGCGQLNHLIHAVSAGGWGGESGSHCRQAVTTVSPVLTMQTSGRFIFNVFDRQRVLSSVASGVDDKLDVFRIQQSSTYVALSSVKLPTIDLDQREAENQRTQLESVMAGIVSLASRFRTRRLGTHQMRSVTLRHSWVGRSRNHLQ